MRIRTTKHRLCEIGSRVILLLIIVFVVISVRCPLMRISCVEGDSMEDTLHDGEFGIVLTFEKPKQDSVIVAKESDGCEDYYIVKRVIATEGDVVSIFNNAVYVNGEQYQDVHAKAGSRMWNMENSVVPARCYFVLGDNRNVSLDSRYSEVGFVPSESVIGVFHKVALH